MKKRISILITLLLFPLLVNSAPPTRTDNYISGTTADPAAVTRNEDAIFTYLQTGVDTLAINSVTSLNIVDATIVNADIASNANIPGSKLNLSTPGTIGATSASAGTFTTLNITSFGSDWTNAGRTVADAGILTTVDINGGTIDGAIIGGASTAAGSFTNITGTGTATFNDDSNTTVALITNDGTGYGLSIQQNGLLAADKHALFIYSNADNDTTADGLVFIHQDNASAESVPFRLTNDGVKGTMTIIGVPDGASTLINLNIGAGAGTQISGTGNENLSNAGVWTDRTSLFADKENLAEITAPEFIDKLKAMKIYRYQKKSEVYGNKLDKDINGKEIKKKDRKYSTIKIRPNAKEYVGLILDDPTTPEELISRDLEGNINGKSGTQIAEFLLGVCKELITRIEVLEAQ